LKKNIQKQEPRGRQGQSQHLICKALQRYLDLKAAHLKKQNPIEAPNFSKGLIGEDSSSV
jgi:hypothetical protein